MLLQDTYLPKTILKILLPELFERTAAVVFRAHIFREQDFSACLADAIVVFIVLIADQLFIVKSNLFDDGAGVGWKRHCICQFGLTSFSAKRRVSHPKLGTHSKRSNLGNKILTNRAHGSAHPVHILFFKVPDAIGDVVFSDHAMPVHTNEDFALRFGDENVHSGRYNLFWIVKKPDARIVFHPICN